MPPLWSTVCRSGRHLIPPLQINPQRRKRKIDGQWSTIRTKTCPSHPETNNNTKLSRNWGQPPATSLTMNKRRARLKGGTLSRFFWSKNFKIFTYWYTNNCQNENILNSPTLVHCTEVRFASFLSGGFITVIVVNPPERKLAKRTSVRWSEMIPELELS